jgi:hypothetical protein
MDPQGLSSLPIESTEGTQAVANSAQAPEETNLLGNSRADLIGLETNNTLAFIELSPLVGRPRVLVRRIQVRNVSGTLLGIDYRPATGVLYALDDTGILYTLDPFTGRVLSRQALSMPFLGGSLSGFDFNPVADRLRLTAANKQNFRVNVDTGVVSEDGLLAFPQVPPLVGNPFVTASGYTNSQVGASSTQLFNIDTNLDRLLLQNPPNDGSLQDIGSLGVDFSPSTGFDIVTDAAGMNTAYAVSGSTLYTLDLNTGRATFLAKLPRGPYIGLAARVK